MIKVNRDLLLRLTAFLAIAALAAAAFGGCGGGGDSSAAGSTSAESSSGGVETIETSSLDKEEFIEQADEICSQGRGRFLELIVNYMAKHESANKTEGEVTAEGVQKTLLPKFQIEIDEIRKLGAPAGDEEQIEEFLAAMQHAVDALEKRNEVELATDIDREFAHAGDLALNYGMQYCAN